MIKIYGMSTCPDCVYLYDQIEDRQEFEMIDIGSHVKYLKEFLKLRDKEPVFDDCRENGYVGIPCFLLEDGTVTLTPEDVRLKKRPTEDEHPSCSLKGGC